MTAPSHWAGLLRSLNCDGRRGLILLVCLAGLLLPLAGGQELIEQWRYERTAVAAGQWWRLLSAHVVHLDARHALVNATGFTLLWALFARSLGLGRWLLVLGITVAAIDGGFWFLSTGLAWYVGASALLHGIFACGCLVMVRQRDRIALLALAVFVAKLAWEQWHGPLPLAGDIPVVTVSHLYGAIGGALAWLVLGRNPKPLY